MLYLASQSHHIFIQTKYRCHNNHFLYFSPPFNQTTNITDLYKLFYLAGRKIKQIKKKKKFDLQNTEHEGKPISIRKVKKHNITWK